MANAFTPISTQAPSSNTAATRTLAAQATARWVLTSVSWSYSDTPTNGSLTITWGSNTMTYYITAGGPGILTFASKLKFPTNTAVTITLAAAGVTGTVYMDAETE